MVKNENERVVVTLPKWLLKEFKKTKYYTVVADGNVSNSVRIFMLTTVVDEKKINPEELKIPKV